MAYSKEQLEEVLVKLYDSGRTDDAFTIAQELNKLNTANQQPQVETPERSILGALDDAAKGVTSSTVQAAADSARGIGMGVSAGVRDVSEGGTGLPQGSLFSPAGLVQGLFKTMSGIKPEEEQARRQAADETGTQIREVANKVAAPLDYVAKDIRGSMSERGKQLSNTTQIKGNVIEVLKGNEPLDSLGFTEDATGAGMFQNAANSVGSIVYALTVGKLTGSHVMAGAAGGTAAANEGAANARQRIKEIPDAKLADDSPLFASLLESGVSPEIAREHVIQRAEELAAKQQGAVAALSDAFMSKFMSKGLRKIGNIKTPIGQRAANIAVAGGQEGISEMTEGLAAERGMNQVVRTQYGVGSFENLVMGAITGGPLGGGRSTRVPENAKAPSDKNKKVLDVLDAIVAEDKAKTKEAEDQEFNQDIPMSEEEAMDRGEPRRAAPNPRMTTEEAMFRGEPQTQPQNTAMIDEEAVSRVEPTSAEFVNTASEIEASLGEPTITKRVPTNLAADAGFAPDPVTGVTPDIEKLPAVPNVDYSKLPQTNEELARMTDRDINALTSDPVERQAFKAQRDAVAHLDPQAKARLQRRRAYQRQKEARRAQLAEADNLDQQANQPDNDPGVPVSDPMFSNPLRSIEGEVDTQNGQDRSGRDRLRNALFRGKHTAPNRNVELGHILETVATDIDPNVTPAHYRLILLKVIATIKRLESLGINTKLDLVDLDNWNQLYDHDGKPASRGHVEPRKPDARNPNGQYIVRLKHDLETESNDGINFTTLLHESIHVATLGVIEAVEKGLITDKAVVKAVAEIREIKTQVFEDYVMFGPASAKGTTVFMAANKDLFEFVAYGMTSRLLEEHLKNTPDRRNPVRSLWNRFTKAVLDAIGIDTSSRVTQYESLLFAFDTIMTKPFKDPSEVLTWLAPMMKEGQFAHEIDLKEVLTKSMVRQIRDRAAAAFLRIQRDNNVSPYSGFELLSEPLDKTGYVFHGMDEEGLFSGQVPATPNGILDAPYVYVGRPGDTDYKVVVNIPNSTAFLAIRARFPEYTIMTGAQGTAYVRTGKTPEQFGENPVKADDSVKIEKELRWLFGEKEKKGPSLEIFKDIHDVSEAMELMKHSGKDMSTNVFDFVVGGPNAQAILHNNPLLRFVRASVHYIVRAQSIMARKHVHPMGELWFSMKEENRQLAMDIAMRQDHAQRDFTVQELTAAGVPSDVITLLQKMRAALQESITEWNKNRVILGQKPVNVRTGFFPSLFTGDYRVIVRNEKGETMGVVTSDSELGLKNKMKKIKDMFNWAEFDAPIRIGMERRNLYSDSAWDQLELISKFMEDSSTSQEVKDEFGQFLQKLSFDDTRHILGFSRHEKHKKGVWGSEGKDPTKTKKENTHAAFQSLINYLEDGANHHAQMITLADLSTITTDPDMRARFPHTVQYIDDLYQHISRRKPPSGAESRQGAALHSVGRGIDAIIEGALRLTGIGPNKYRRAQAHTRAVFSAVAMGFMNIGFTFVQIMQVVQCGPQAASYLRTATGLELTSTRGRLASAEAVVAVMRMFVDFMANKYGGKPLQGFDWFGGDADTRAAMQYAVENNLITLNDLELAHTAQMSPGMRKMDTFINLNQRASEAATRPLVYMWLYNILKHSNLSKQEQYEVARNATNFVMAEYHATARPMIYQSLGTSGPLLGQLKTFAHSYTGQQIFWSKVAAKGETARPLIALMFAYMLYVGADDMPIYDELDTILKIATKGLHAVNEDIPELSYKDWLAPHMPDMLRYGIISSYTGIDFQKRLKMPPLIQDELFANTPALNYAGGVIKDWGKFLVESFRQGEKDDALAAKATYNTLPGSLKGPLEQWLFRQGDAELTKDFMGKFTYRNDFDWMLRWTGLRSLEDTLRKEQFNETRNRMKKDADRKQAISEEFVRLNMQKGGIPIEKFHALRAEYQQLGGSLDALDNSLKEAKERLAKGEELYLLEKDKSGRAWFHYQGSRR